MTLIGEIVHEPPNGSVVLSDHAVLTVSSSDTENVYVPAFVAFVTLDASNVQYSRKSSPYVTPTLAVPS